VGLGDQLKKVSALRATVLAKNGVTFESQDARRVGIR
jgi:hypothetical protein